jgi:hypothetical protein
MGRPSARASAISSSDSTAETSRPPSSSGVTSIVTTTGDSAIETSAPSGPSSVTPDSASPSNTRHASLVRPPRSIVPSERRMWE